MKRFIAEPNIMGYAAQLRESRHGDYVRYYDFIKALAMIYNSLVDQHDIISLIDILEDKLEIKSDTVRDAAEKLRKGE